MLALLIGAFVVIAFVSRYPAAISRFVVAVIVGAIEHFSRWTFSHIGEEVSKAIGSTPTLADGYASTTVVSVLREIFVVASGEHVRPRLILTGRFTSNSMAVGGETSACCILSQTPARTRCARVKYATLDDALLAAVAFTKPLSLSVRCVGNTFHDSKTTKALVYDVDSFHRKFLAC